jgi:hypothetical protein
MADKLAKGEVGYFWHLRDDVLCEVEVLDYEPLLFREKYKVRVIQVFGGNPMGLTGRVYFPGKELVCRRIDPLVRERFLSERIPSPSLSWKLGGDELYDQWRDSQNGKNK